MNLKIRDNLLIYGMHFLNKAGRLKVKSLSELDIKKSTGILVVATTALGDAILCTPIFKTMKEAMPEIKIGVFVYQSFATLFNSDPYLNAVIPYYGKFKRVRETMDKIRNEGFNIALVSNANDPDVIPLLYWSGIDGIIRRPQRNTIYPYLIANPEMMSPVHTNGHSIERNMEMLQILGIECKPVKPYLFLSPSADKTVSKYLTTKGVKEGELLIGLHPGASVLTKAWPKERYAELGRKISGTFSNARIILSGSMKEKKSCKEIEREIGSGVINTAGIFSIDELACLISRLSVFVSGDTGPFQMAVALGCKTVTLFGWSDETKTGPLFDMDIHRVIRKAEWNKEEWFSKKDAEKDISPLMSINVDDVLKELMDILQCVE